MRAGCYAVAGPQTGFELCERIARRGKGIIGRALEPRFQPIKLPGDSKIEKSRPHLLVLFPGPCCRRITLPPFSSGKNAPFCEEGRKPRSLTSSGHLRGAPRPKGSQYQEECREPRYEAQARPGADRQDRGQGHPNAA